MQWETATPVGFPVCTRHNDCRLKKTAVCRLKAEMNQQVAFHTLSAPEKEGDDIQVQLVTIRLGQRTHISLDFIATPHEPQKW